MQPKEGGKFHPKLNSGERPIAHKYREGKMQRTLKRELKVPEIAETRKRSRFLSRFGALVVIQSITDVVASDFQWGC